MNTTRIDERIRLLRRTKVKIDIISSHDDKTFIIDISDISHRERVSINTAKSKEERIEELAETIGNNMIEIVKFKIKQHLKGMLYDNIQ